MAGMTDSDGQCIRGVGAGLCAKLQQTHYHVLHLSFVGRPRTDDCKFDRAWRVLMHRQRLRNGGKCRATGLTQLQRAIHIATDEHAFDRHLDGLVGSEQLAERSVDAPQSGCEFRCLDVYAAVRNMQEIGPAGIDDAIARAPGTRIQTEHPHALADSQSHHVSRSSRARCIGIVGTPTTGSSFTHCPRTPNLAHVGAAIGRMIAGKDPSRRRGHGPRYTSATA